MGERSEKNRVKIGWERKKHSGKYLGEMAACMLQNAHALKAPKAIAEVSGVREANGECLQSGRVRFVAAINV